MPIDVVENCRVTGDAALAEHDPAFTFGWSKEDAKSKLVEVMVEVEELQKRLFAEASTAVLVVLQAIDAGGKDGTVRDVFTLINPAGLNVVSFGVPSEEELAHDYLWRIHARLPQRGRIGIFNRSHYEDVLVVRVRELVPAKVWRKRYGHIRDFERMLDDEGTRVVKIFLNVSRDEQRVRLQDRVDDPEERWKFRRGDLEERARWDLYQEAFGDALSETSTKDAPWYVVPADHKWVRNLTVAEIIRHHLRLIDPHYPPPEEDIEGIVVE
jgi:PPK2 family polyphosphate:nucleotide phosphotransferase